MDRVMLSWTAEHKKGCNFTMNIGKGSRSGAE